MPLFLNRSCVPNLGKKSKSVDFVVNSQDKWKKSETRYLSLTKSHQNTKMENALDEANDMITNRKKMISIDVNY